MGERGFLVFEYVVSFNGQELYRGYDAVKADQIFTRNAQSLDLGQVIQYANKRVLPYHISTHDTAGISRI
jgi:hypothetical protein